MIPKISSLSGGEFSDEMTEDQVDILVPITQGLRPRLYEEVGFENMPIIYIGSNPIYNARVGECS